MIDRLFDPYADSWCAWSDPGEPLRLGVSACLLGREVRYDGGHSRDLLIADVLGHWVDWAPVCPEMEIGMGVPRPTIHVERHDDELRLIQPSTGRDFTRTMTTFARRRVTGLMREDLDGYIFKSRSPSCATQRLKIYEDGRVASRDGRGFFAAELLDRWPGLPVEDEARLGDAARRDTFVDRMLSRHRWRTMIGRGRSDRRLVAFHAAHEMLLLTHNAAGYRRLGRLVDELGSRPNRDIFADYAVELDRTMAKRATVKRHVDVLRRGAGRLENAIDAAAKAALHEAIESYRTGRLPLAVPISRMRHEALAHGVEDLAGQIYLHPHPVELSLRCCT